jgi:hypothetical protein
VLSDVSAAAPAMHQHQQHRETVADEIIQEVSDKGSDYANGEFAFFASFASTRTATTMGHAS